MQVDKKLEGTCMNDPIINVGHLTKKYQDVKAVDDLSLLINKGELFGLLGQTEQAKPSS